MNRGRTALFLDRDGVINVDHGYVGRPEEFEFVDGIFDLCRVATERDYLIVVVTNQAGIGRGYYTEQEFHALSAWMCDAFLAQAIKIARVYFCPYHPEHGIGDYKRESGFRKPGPGMILEAARDFNLDLPSSVLVGDKASDVTAGMAAGVGRNFLYWPNESPPALSDAIVVRSLFEVGRQLSGNNQ